MGKKCKKKVQWKPLSLGKPNQDANLEGDEAEDEDESPPDEVIIQSPHHKHPTRGGVRPMNRRWQQDWRREGDEMYAEGDEDGKDAQNNKEPYHRSPTFYRPYGRREYVPFPPDQHRDRPYWRPYSDRGYVRRPFRPYGRNTYRRSYVGDDDDSCCRDDEEPFDEGDEDRPSQPVHTVYIDNEVYTKIQTPRQEVIFKKNCISDRHRHTTRSSSCSDSTSDRRLEEEVSAELQLGGGMVDEEVLYQDPCDLFAYSDPGQPPLAGVVMQQAYPGGPMVAIPVRWSPFIDPTLIPGETALTPLDPAFTHVLDPKSLPIDPAHIMPIQHDAQGCPVHVQVKVDRNGAPIHIEPSAFTVALSSLPQFQPIVFNHGSEDLSCLVGAEGGTEEGEGKSRTRRRRKKEEGKKEEQGRDSGESSDSNDSQYASMSDSSIPTSPSVETSNPCDIVRTNSLTSSTTQDNVSPTSSQETESLATGVSSESQTDTTPVSSVTDHPCVEDETNVVQLDNHSELKIGATVTDDSSNATIPVDYPLDEECLVSVPGYVMVPILTPYYDPAAFYGYPVTMATEPMLPFPSPIQRGFNKRKKKKFPRKRMNDLNGQMEYLDPQLYTGEPFILGGSLSEFLPSLCQVHEVTGVQYMLAPFTPLRDDGFVSVPPSPYSDQVMVPELLTVATEIEDSLVESKRDREIFADLQEEEKREISEMLLEHPTPPTTGVTESADSGLSETEETAVPLPEKIDVVCLMVPEDEAQEVPNCENDVEMERVTQCIEENVTDKTQRKMNKGRKGKKGKGKGGHKGDKRKSSVSSKNGASTVELTKGKPQSLSDEIAVKIQQDAADVDVRICDATGIKDGEIVKVQLENCCYLNSDQMPQNVQMEIPNVKMEIEEETSMVRGESQFVGDFAKAVEGIVTGYMTQEKDNEVSTISEEGWMHSEDCIASSAECNHSEYESEDQSQQAISDSHLISCIALSENCNIGTGINSTDLLSKNTLLTDQVTEEQSKKESIEKTVQETMATMEEPTIYISKSNLLDTGLDINSLKCLQVTNAVRQWIYEVSPENIFKLSEEAQNRLILENDLEYVDEFEPECDTESEAAILANHKAIYSNCVAHLAVHLLNNKSRELTPDNATELTSSLSSLSRDRLFSDSSLASIPNSMDRSFDDEDLAEEIAAESCDPSVYSRYYQLGVTVDDSTPVLSPVPMLKTRESTPDLNAIFSPGNSVTDAGGIGGTLQVCRRSPIGLAGEIDHGQGSRCISRHNAFRRGGGVEMIRSVDISDSGVPSDESGDEGEALGRRNIVGSTTVLLSPSCQGEHSLPKLATMAIPTQEVAVLPTHLIRTSLCNLM